MEVAFCNPLRSPGQIGISIPNCFLMANAVLAAGLSLILALVETIGPLNALHNAAAIGWLVTLTAKLECWPRNQVGTQCCAGTIQVVGPGQVDSMC